MRAYEPLLRRKMNRKGQKLRRVPWPVGCATRGVLVLEGAAGVGDEIVGGERDEDNLDCESRSDGG